MRKIGKYSPVILSAFLFAAYLIIARPSGEDVLEWPWKTFTVLISLSLVYTGLKKEGAFSLFKNVTPLFKRTYSLIIFIEIAAFFISTVLSGYLTALFLGSLAISVLKEKERESISAFSVCQIAISAAAGSMMLPTGSPSNLILSEYGVKNFALIMWPFSFLILFYVVLVTFFALRLRPDNELYLQEKPEISGGSPALRMLYICIAFSILLSALNIVRWIDVFLLIILILLAFDRKVIIMADYKLPVAIFLSSTAILGIAWVRSSFALSVTLTEIIGSTLSVPILAPRSLDPKSLLVSVSIGSIGLPTALPAIASFSLSNDKRKFPLIYSALSVPLLVLLIILYLIIG